MVTALVEAGKREVVLESAPNDGCVAIIDVTAYGSMRDYGRTKPNEKEPPWLGGRKN